MRPTRRFTACPSTSVTHVATVHPLFSDEAQATVANSAAGSGAGAGKIVHLALTDPDSSEVVPSMAPRFRGDFMLTSQGDQQQIYVSTPPPRTRRCRC